MTTLNMIDPRHCMHARETKRPVSMALWGAALCRALLLLLLCAHHHVHAESLKSAVKMRNSNPVLSILVEDEPVNLILTTDYSRRLLRFQLQGILQEFVLQDIEVPAVNYTGNMPLGYFSLRKQWLSPASVEYFLQSSRASGFIGVGFAFRPMYSRFWTMLPDDALQRYAYRGMRNTTSKVALLSVNDAQKSLDLDSNEGMDSEDDALVEGDNGASSSLVWSEPLASMDELDDAGNNQGISFPIHQAFFRCASSLSSAGADGGVAANASAAIDAQASHKVEIFGEFSNNWDVVVDFNTPCLALPQQFFDALAGWIGLQYIDELKLAELPSSKILPDLVFSMSLGGPRITIPLQQLVLPDLQVLPSSASDAKTRVCIQRSGSIVQDGTSIFSPLEPDAGSVQRYRLHGSLALPLFNMIQAPIVFGSMVLNTFDELVVDGLTKRTGIRNLVGGSGNASFLSSPLSSSSNAVSATCMRPAQCIGQQRYLSRLNACQGRSSPAS